MNMQMLEGGLAATIIKATLAVVLALVLLRLTRRASASLRHLLAATTFVLLLLLPAVSALMPKRVIATPAPPPVVTRDGNEVALSPGRPVSSQPENRETGRAGNANYATIAFGAYLAGTALLIITLAGGLWRVRRMREHAEVSVAGTRVANDMARAAGHRGGIEVLVSSELAVPITFGFGRRTILLPAATSEWSEEELCRAIRHELEHIARGDWATQIVARVACAVYWPHPLVWILWSRLRLEAERACDDAVIRTAGEAESYAEQLVSLARRLVGRGSVPVLAMATRSNLGLRVEAILDRGLRRAPLTRLGSISVAAAAVACLLVIAPFELMSDPVRRVAERWSEDKADEDVDALDIALMEAAADGDLRKMHSLLERGAKANAGIRGDGSPLIAASRNGHLEAMKTLIEHGADVNRGVRGDGNPLLNAAREGQLEAVRLLLDRGAAIDRGVLGDGNALIMAAGAGHVEVVRFLLDAGADIEAVVPGDENPLIHASENGQAEVVRLLLARGANVNARVWAESWNGGRVRGEWRTPLNMAARNRHDTVVEMLRAAGARE